jgi:hypothetical protein
MSEIVDLFRARDKAVAAKDATLLLSTQVDEIPQAGSAGYLALKRLTTRVVATVPEASSPTKVVFVKETYRDDTGATRSAYLLYHLVDTPTGWRIYRVSS